MSKNTNLLLLTAIVIGKVVILPIGGLALSLFLFTKSTGLVMDGFQIAYISSILRWSIYTVVRTIKLDWRD